MSEVKKYLIQKTPIGTLMKVNAKGNWIDLSDYDAALAREAALREERDALQQRLTVAEKRLGEAYEWGYGDGQNAPNGYSEKEDRDKCVAELLKPAS